MPLCAREWDIEENEKKDKWEIPQARFFSWPLHAPTNFDPRPLINSPGFAERAARYKEPLPYISASPSSSCSVTFFQPLASHHFYRVLCSRIVELSASSAKLCSQVFRHTRRLPHFHCAYIPWETNRTTRISKCTLHLGTQVILPYWIFSYLRFDVCSCLIRNCCCCCCCCC